MVIKTKYILVFIMNQKLSASNRPQKEKIFKPNYWNNLLPMQLDNHTLSFLISYNHPAVTLHFYRRSQAQDNTLSPPYGHFSDETVGGQYI